MIVDAKIIWVGNHKLGCNDMYRIVARKYSQNDGVECGRETIVEKLELNAFGEDIWTSKSVTPETSTEVISWYIYEDAADVDNKCSFSIDDYV